MSQNLNNQIGQLLVIGIKGTVLDSEEKKFIVDNNIGGVIFFARNIESPKQIHGLISELQSLRHKMADKAPLFIGVDMEGGRVARLKAPFTQWPPLKKLGELDSATLCFKFAETMGIELRSIGFNLDFAPCVDILTNPKNTVIGDRSLGSDSENVAKLGSALVRGYIKANIIPCAKHFPGHGNTLLDSHEDLPVEKDVDLARLLEIELNPFKRAFRARLDMVLTAHIQFPKIDPEWPATLSEIFLKKILRGDLGYRNLVITDDLDMKALTKNYSPEVIPVRALQAGNDLLLYCNDPTKPPIALVAIEKALESGALKKEEISEKHGRILALKKSKMKTPDPQDLATVSRLIGHPDHLRLSKAIFSGEVPADLAT